MRRFSIFTKTHHFAPQTNKPSSTWARMCSTLSTTPNKIVVIMGPTGCGKSKLSIDLASTFLPSSEIINSDKIQVYHGLEITTNKIPFPDRRNVPHHLLGESDSPEFTPSDFRAAASAAVSQIHRRGHVPFLVGGSNSFIYALLAKKFDPELDVFSDSGNSVGDSVFCKELRYRCCFIWVDISLPVLDAYLVKRVNDMLDSGMVEELAEFLKKPGSGDYSVSRLGLRKAIGVSELERYFNINTNEAYEEAVREIKENTCRLARRQVGKIRRLRDGAGWDLKRVETTAAIRAAMEGGGDGAEEIWEREVVEPSVNIVKRFLSE